MHIAQHLHRNYHQSATVDKDFFFYLNFYFPAFFKLFYQFSLDYFCLTIGIVCTFSMVSLQFYPANFCGFLDFYVSQTIFVRFYSFYPLSVRSRKTGTDSLRMEENGS